MEEMKDITEYWDDRTVVRSEDLVGVMLPTKDIEFLTTVGLPTNLKLIAAKLNIQNAKAHLSWHNTEWKLKGVFHSWPYFHFLPRHITSVKFAGDEYVVIGQTIGDTRIALQSKNGKVYCLYEKTFMHKEDAVQFVNSDIQSYLRCVSQYIIMSAEFGLIIGKYEAIHREALKNWDDKSIQEELEMISQKMKNWYDTFKVKINQIDPQAIEDDECEWYQFLFL